MVFLFIFSNYFILVRVTVDSEPIPGTLGQRQEQTLKSKESNFGSLIEHRF